MKRAKSQLNVVSIGSEPHPETSATSRVGRTLEEIAALGDLIGAIDEGVEVDRSTLMYAGLMIRKRARELSELIDAGKLKCDPA